MLESLIDICVSKLSVMDDIKSKILNMKSNGEDVSAYYTDQLQNATSEVQNATEYADVTIEKGQEAINLGGNYKSDKFHLRGLNSLGKLAKDKGTDLGSSAMKTAGVIVNTAFDQKIAFSKDSSIHNLADKEYIRYNKNGTASGSSLVNANDIVTYDDDKKLFTRHIKSLNSYQGKVSQNADDIFVNKQYNGADVGGTGTKKTGTPVGSGMLSGGTKKTGTPVGSGMLSDGTQDKTMSDLISEYKKTGKQPDINTLVKAIKKLGIPKFALKSALPSILAQLGMTNKLNDILGLLQ